MAPHIGFIGLGDIGMPMARRVLDGGFKVTSSARKSRDAIELLKTLGLTEVSTSYEVAIQSDLLITMVVDEAQTDNVLRGSHGALAGLVPGSVVIVMSTVSPEYCQALATETEPAGINVLDCPVAGGRPRAERGELTLICGGDVGLIDRCRPVLETMGSISHCGPIGMGQVVKLANNGLVASQFKLVQEVRAMSAAYGMDLDTLMNTISRSTGNSFVVENWNFLEHNWHHLGPMAKKDLDLCIAAAAAKDVPVPLLQTTGRDSAD